MELPIEIIRKEKKIAEGKIRNALQELTDKTGMRPLDVEFQMLDVRTLDTPPMVDKYVVGELSVGLRLA